MACSWRAWRLDRQHPPRYPCAHEGRSRLAFSLASALVFARSRELRLKPNAIVSGHGQPPGTGVRDVAFAIVQIGYGREAEALVSLGEPFSEAVCDVAPSDV